MLAVILLSAVVEARGRYRTPSPERQAQIAERAAGQMGRIDAEKASVDGLRAQAEKAQADLLAAQAKFDHEQKQLELLHQYTVELTALQKESEANAERIDEVVKKIQALNLAGLQEAAHEVKEAQAETVQAAEAAGQPVSSAVAEAAVEADKVFAEAAHAATAGGSPSALVETSAATEAAPMGVEQTVAAPEVTKVIEESTPIPTPEAGMSPEPSMTEIPESPNPTAEVAPVAVHAS